MAYEFKTVRRVEFSDTDMAGIMHFSNFFRYMETVEHGFYRSLGFSVILAGFDPPVGFPRVHASCDYQKPLRFEDEAEMHLIVEEKRSKSLSYLIRFRRLGGSPVVVACGKITVVCVRHEASGRMSAVNLPPVVSERIETAPSELITAFRTREGTATN